MTCNTPPATTCEDPNSLRVFNTHGTCGGGACFYSYLTYECSFGCSNGACNEDPCIGVTCMTPPASTCEDQNTLRAYNATGTCGGGRVLLFLPDA